MSHKSDHAGKKYGRWLVIRDSESKNGRRMLFCRCDCGTEKDVHASCLVQGYSKSCGCYHSDRARKHGEYGIPEYRIWGAMIQRCCNPSDKAYSDYGGRGISVCERWRNSFGLFLKDIGKRPTRKHSLDRINNNGNYSPSNCRWGTPEQQHNNMRSNVWIEFNGDRRTLSQWSRKLGVGRGMLKSRIERGWNIQRTLTEPSHSQQ